MREKKTQLQVTQIYSWAMPSTATVLKYEVQFLTSLLSIETLKKVRYSPADTLVDQYYWPIFNRCQRGHLESVSMT